MKCLDDFLRGRFEVPAVAQCVTYLTLLKLIKTCWVRHDEINILNYGDYGLMLTSGITKSLKRTCCIAVLMMSGYVDAFQLFLGNWNPPPSAFFPGKWHKIAFDDAFHSPFSHVLHVGCIPVNPLAAVAALRVFDFRLTFRAGKKTKNELLRS